MKKLTPEETAQRRRHVEQAFSENRTLTSIADELGVSPSAVTTWCRRQGITVPGWKPRDLVLGEAEFERRKAAVERGIAERRPMSSVAKELGIAAATLYYFCRTHGILTPRESTGSGTDHRVTLTPDLKRRLSPHAIARGMPPEKLAARLLRTVVDDDLFDAVLDDGGDGEVAV